MSPTVVDNLHLCCTGSSLEKSQGCYSDCVPAGLCYNQQTQGLGHCLKFWQRCTTTTRCWQYQVLAVPGAGSLSTWYWCCTSTKTSAKTSTSRLSSGWSSCASHVSQQVAHPWLHCPACPRPCVLQKACVFATAYFRLPRKPTMDRHATVALVRAAAKYVPATDCL